MKLAEALKQRADCQKRAAQRLKPSYEGQRQGERVIVTTACRSGRRRGWEWGNISSVTQPRGCTRVIFFIMAHNSHCWGWNYSRLTL